jgi:hypothetical protein
MEKTPPLRKSQQRSGDVAERAGWESSGAGDNFSGAYN